jgi:hypothetical protein
LYICSKEGTLGTERGMETLLSNGRLGKGFMAAGEVR